MVMPVLQRATVPVLAGLAGSLDPHAIARQAIAALNPTRVR
jgi:hypothetical protein